MRRSLLLPLLAIVAIAAACASPGGARRAPTGSRDVLTAEEIATAAGVTTAFEAVQRLRPEFLRARSTTSIRGSAAPEPPVLYVDNVRFGSLDGLRNVLAQHVQEIRRVSAADATTLYGTGHMGGVIAVLTKR